MRNALLKLSLIVLLICSGSALAQDQPCEGSNCQNPTNQVDSQSDIRYQDDIERQPTGTPSGTTVRPNLSNQQSEELRRGQAPSREGRGTEGYPQALICPGPNCPRMLPEEKTEFQKFVFTTTGEKLSIYGRNLFETSPSTFAPVDHVPVPADYVVGPGDELLIRAWGQIDVNARVVVDRNGQVYLPRVGTVNVAGIRYDQLTGYLKNAVSRVFKNFDLNVTMGQLRSIQIFVVGQARRPGTYTVSSLSTLVTALFASGGPSVNGSMRHIQLKRQNQVVTEFDVYDLLGRGDKSKDSALLPGDVIYIPPVGKQIAIMGSVNLPAIYEIDDKTSVSDQIAIAGGLSTTADGTRVVVERIENRTTRTVQELKLNDEGLAQKLQDGDVVRVFPISPRVEGSIVLRGSVAVPGRFPWREGMRVSDLIPSKDTIVTRDYWMRQTMLSRSEMGWQNPEPRKDGMDKTGDNTREQDFDPSLDPGLQSKTEPSYGTGSGTNYDTSRQMSGTTSKKDNGWSDGRITSDLTRVVRNPAEINWDYAVIQRLNRQDLSSELIPFNLGKALEDHSSADNIPLQSGDVITIFSQADLAVPAEKRTKFVWVEGEVKSAGVYRVEPGETLRDVVNQAGGLTPSAYLFGSEFRRVSTRNRQQLELNKFIESMEQDLRGKLRVIGASLNPEDRIAGQQELQAQQQSIERLRQVQPTGRIVLELKPTDTTVSELPAVALEDGDRLIIPARPATIGVVGAVYSPNSFLYEDHGNVSKYIRYAGGGTRDADKGRAFIVRANGSVISKQMYSSLWSGGFEGLQLYPGDAIVMPERIKSSNVLRGLRDWTQVFAQLALGAAALKTLAP
jgi:polysaccharide export outer membrane protein